MEMIRFELWRLWPVLVFSQDCLEKCGESLQEIVNYHMVRLVFFSFVSPQMSDCGMDPLRAVSSLL